MERCSVRLRRASKPCFTHLMTRVIAFARTVRWHTCAEAGHCCYRCVEPRQIVSVSRYTLRLIFRGDNFDFN
jgi:hypothetical protein